MPPTSEIQRIAAAALAEDGPSDLTSMLTVQPGLSAEGRLEYRNGGVLAGTAYAAEVASACRCTVEWQAAEGASVRPGAIIGISKSER